MRWKQLLGFAGLCSAHYTKRAKQERQKKGSCSLKR